MKMFYCHFSVVTLSSKEDTAICLYTETKRWCSAFEETLHKSDMSKQSDLHFLNFTDKSCSQQIMPLIPRIDFDWFCLVSGTNETEIVPNSPVVFSCTSGIISDSCEQQQILSNALCDEDILENVSLECYEISLTESSEAVCTRAFRVDECHNFVETTLMGKEGE